MPHFSSSALLFAHPLQGATVYALPISTGSKFLLTRPSRGATRAKGRDEGYCRHFYSHAPRGARLLQGSIDLFALPDFYSHAPHGARLYKRNYDAQTQDFYSHAPRGARL